MNNNTNSPAIALTFDDGPNTTTTYDVLAKLKKYGVTASFFVVGDKINPDTKGAILTAVEQGCEICNHSKTHSPMPNLSENEISNEITFTSQKIKALTNTEVKFFRPPYIVVNETMLDIIKLPFICGIGAEDWLEDVSATERAERILSAVKDGDIILLHDFEGNEKTVAALDLIIPSLLEKGFKFATVSELFELKAITPQMGKIIYSNVMQSE